MLAWCWLNVGDDSQTGRTHSRRGFQNDCSPPSSALGESDARLRTVLGSASRILRVHKAALHGIYISGFEHNPWLCDCRIPLLRIPWFVLAVLLYRCSDCASSCSLL